MESRGSPTKPAAKRFVQQNGVPVKKKTYQFKKIKFVPVKNETYLKIKFVPVKTILLPVQKNQKSAREKKVGVKKVKKGVRSGREK